MPRSRINGNFIDKTFSIVANILLRIIPTTSGEKEAFTYYRDGAIWFFSLSFSVLLEIYRIRNRKKRYYWNKPTLVEGEVWKYNNPFYRVSSVDAALDASILDLSLKRKVTPMGSGLRGNPTLLVPIGGIGEEALHIGINNTKTLL